MEEIVLKAVRRDVIGKQVSALRRAGQLPAVLYGIGVEPTPISLDMRQTSRTLAGVTGSTLVTIELDGERYLALVREKQRNTLLGTLRHIDFQAVSTREKLRVAVPVEMTGESPAVVEFDAVLVTGQESLQVESLPQDLPESITVDVSVIKEIGNAIYVRDLQIPANVTVLTDPDEMVVLATAPAAEEVEEEAVEEVAEAEEPEVIERGKHDEEEDF